MIDVNKLPAPQIVEELDYETILTAMRVKLAELLPDWTASDLESDPANKVLEVAAYREMLMRQRVNESVRACMLAFARSTDLDHLAANFGVERLAAAQATFTADLALSVELDLPCTIQAGFTVVSSNGEVSAKLMRDVVIPAGSAGTKGHFELIAPEGSSGNALNLAWNAITPLPFVVQVTQTTPSTGGSDAESDNSFRLRIPLSLERFSTAGPAGAYEYWARSADERIADVKILSPEPGEVTIVLLSADNDGVADSAMIERVTAMLSNEKIRPLDDLLSVQSAEAITYTIEAALELYKGTATSPVYTEAVARLTAKAQSLARLGKDIKRSALIAAAHVEGVRSVALTAPASDITVTDSQFARCTAIEVMSDVADED